MRSLTNSLSAIIIEGIPVHFRHVFHYVVEDSITFLCMADEDAKRRVPFAFLDDIKVIIDRHTNRFGGLTF